MENPALKNDHHKISPTAKIAAYWRSLSDIPYAAEIADSLEAEKTARELLGDRMKVMASFWPVSIEARYKAINYGLKESGVANVLELACGLSPRGLELAASNIHYVGTDLPEIHAESYPIINGIASRSGISPAKFRMQPANALDKAQLEKAVEHFKGKSFGICNEGFLMYLTRAEQKVLAQNVRDLLMGSGGVWVTTDLVYGDLRKRFFNLLSPELKKVVESALGDISNQVGREIVDNDFADETQAVQFFENLGFQVEKFPMYNGSYQLSTLSNVPAEMKEAMLIALTEVAGWKGWILTPAV